MVADGPQRCIVVADGAWRLRRSEKHFFQHLNKASPDYGAQVVI